MEVLFKPVKIKKESEDHKKLSKEYGDLQAKKIITRLTELYSAESLWDIWKLPQTRLHALSGNFKGCFSVDLKHPYRLIFSPLNGDTANLKTVTKIQIHKLHHDYH